MKTEINTFKEKNLNKKISLFIFVAIIITNLILPFKIISNGFQKNIANAEGCSIISAGWTPSGEQKDGFYTGGSSTANIVVKSKNCVDKTGVNLTIYESDRFPLINTDDSWNDSKLDRREIAIPSDNFTIKIKLGEEDCESGLTGAVGYDCDLFFYIRQTDTTIYNSWHQNKGNLYYECDGMCQDNASFMGVISNGTDAEPINIDAIAATNIPDTYTLLAPIGELKEAPKNIGDYFNTIFKIAIGLCGALAVIMIVIGGVQYMGNESIFGQTEAKKQITTAILGLIIALASYALLNTLNPALLGKDGVTIAQVSAEIEEPPMLQESSDIPAPGTTVNQCASGIEKITMSNGSTMHLCKSISAKVLSGLNSAIASGIKLSGAAFRSKTDQVALRTKNKCPDVYKSPASACIPPTALPGTSMHESGLAIDFKCEGNTIRARDNKCFLWLSANAGSFGLQNFSKEPWHWSTNGH